MKDQLELLRELQRIDLVLQETDQSLEALPATLEALAADVARLEEILAADRERLAELERYRKEVESTIRDEQIMAQQGKARLGQVKNSREYLAIQRELETNRRVTGERERELAKLVEAITELAATVADREGKLGELKQHQAEEDARVRGEIARLEASVTDKRAEREAMADKLQAQALRRYDAIRKRRGVAVVEARGGVCTGCHMSLPPQLYNIAQRRSTLEMCPNCNRIIYVPEKPADPE